MRASYHDYSNGFLSVLGRSRGPGPHGDPRVVQLQQHGRPSSRGIIRHRESSPHHRLSQRPGPRCMPEAGRRRRMDKCSGLARRRHPSISAARTAACQSPTNDRQRLGAEVRAVVGVSEQERLGIPRDDCTILYRSLAEKLACPACHTSVGIVTKFKSICKLPRSSDSDAADRWGHQMN
jgi:hypothetical protein